MNCQSCGALLLEHQEFCSRCNAITPLGQKREGDRVTFFVIVYFVFVAISVLFWSVGVFTAALAFITIFTAFLLCKNSKLIKVLFWTTLVVGVIIILGVLILAGTFFAAIFN